MSFIEFRYAGDDVELGACEIRLTSIDADGYQSGYDRDLARAAYVTVLVPVIASGGAWPARSLVWCLHPR